MNQNRLWYFMTVLTLTIVLVILSLPSRFSEAQQDIMIDFAIDPEPGFLGEEVTLVFTATDSSGRLVPNVDYHIRVEDLDPLYSYIILENNALSTTGRHTEKVTIHPHTCEEGANWSATVEIVGVDFNPIEPIRKVFTFSLAYRPAEPALQPDRPAIAPEPAPSPDVPIVPPRQPLPREPPPREPAFPLQREPTHDEGSSSTNLLGIAGLIGLLAVIALVFVAIRGRRE